MNIKDQTEQVRANQVTASFISLGFKTLKAFIEVLKMDKSITLIECCNCWDGKKCSAELKLKIESVIEVLKEGDHPLEYIVKGERFKIDNSFTTIDYKGTKSVMFTKKVGNSTYTTFSIETLKYLCDNHIEPDTELKGRAINQFYNKR